MRSSSSSLVVSPANKPTLAEVLGAIQQTGSTTGRRLCLAGDDAPRLDFGAVHEWFNSERVASHSATPDRLGAAGFWLPSVSLMIGLTWRAIVADSAPADGQVVWVGRRCWPFPHALVLREQAEPGGDRRLLERSVFVDSPGRAERVWAIDLALRCEGVAVVIADGSGLTMAASRRLQLAAAAGGTIGLLARPGWERRTLSAAKTRWSITPCVSMTHEQTWMVELLRCKGVQPSVGSARRWVVRRDHATGAIGEWTACDGGVAGEVVDRPASAAGSEIA